jgi:formate dehydrogenase accessory protein FdhD
MASRDPAQVERGVAPDAAHARVELTVERWVNGRQRRESDVVAEEFPVALIYHGVPHVVMLATPADLEDYAVGFTLSEGLVAKPEEIRSVEVEAGRFAIDVRISIASERFSALLQQRRNLTGRTGCGLCGAETVEQAIRTPAPLSGGPVVSVAALHAAMTQLGSLQPLNARTGSVHAAAWALPGSGIRYVREDVGRHNALDKVLGAVIRAGEAPASGYLLITSRASYEMVLKSATVGVAFLAAISAPTSLAVDLATRCGQTLVGFTRPEQHVVYAGAERLVP